jgi:hypothetical protein
VNFRTPLIFAIVLSTLASGIIENPDTHLRLSVAKNIVQNHSLAIPENVGVISHGNIAVNNNGTKYMVYNPGQSILFIPLIIFFQEILQLADEDAYQAICYTVSFFNLFIHCLCSLLVLRILITLGTPKHSSLFTTALFAFTSYSLSAAQSTYEHHYEMLFILASTSAILNNRENPYLPALMISCGVLFRTSTLFAVPALITLIRSNKNKMIFTVALLPALLALASYNLFRFGNIFQTGYSLAWDLAGTPVSQQWQTKSTFNNFLALLFSPSKGLFWASPTALLAITSFPEFLRRHSRFALCCLILASTYLLIIATNFAWHGSYWSFGPRYIIPIIPFIYFSISTSKLSKQKCIFLCIIGMLIQVNFMATNSTRTTLLRYTQNNFKTDETVKWDFTNNIIFSQFQSNCEVASRNLVPLSNRQPPEWISDSRLGTHQQMIEDSIEKTSYNFWWVRILHWNQLMTPFILMFTSMLVLMANFITIRYAIRQY